MLSVEQMKQKLDYYILEFDVFDKRVLLSGPSSGLFISYKRALEWIDAGIQDLDCRTKEQMIDLINSWMEEE